MIPASKGFQYNTVTQNNFVINVLSLKKFGLYLLLSVVENNLFFLLSLDTVYSLYSQNCHLSEDYYPYYNRIFWVFFPLWRILIASILNICFQSWCRLKNFFFQLCLSEN